MSGDDPCTCNWFVMQPSTDCPVHFTVCAPEIFPGTLAALNALTIRKATP